MKKIFAVFILIIITGCSTVQGVIRDKETGTPVPSAHVVINRDSGSTDALGYYKVTGAFTIGDRMMVNAPGYHIYTRTIKNINEIIDIDLTSK